MVKDNPAKPPWWQSLACPSCKQALRAQDDKLFCDQCLLAYPVRDGVPIFVNLGNPEDFQVTLGTPEGREMVSEYSGSSLWVRFIKTVRRVISSDYIPYPPDLQGWITQRGAQAMVLEVGSGQRRLHPGVINLDIGPFPNVDIVADGAMLPFLDERLDFVILDVVLEHVKQPRQFIQEAQRVLIPGGLLYVALPFVHPYHGYPADYHRFSVDSLPLLTTGFTALKTGVLRGPMSALLNCFSDLPFLFTFSDNHKVYQATKGMVLIFTFWLKYLDKLLVKNQQAHRLAHTLYFFGEKMA
jgi:SAM-dependent methyltransferase